MSEEDIAVPSQDFILESLIGSNVRWIVFCPNEAAQLGDSFATSEEALNAAKFHNQSTGHSAQAAPFYSRAAAGGGEIVAADVVDPIVAWPFCLLFNGSPATSLPVAALSFGEAEMTMAGLVQHLNDNAPAAGYPPIFSYQVGLCGGN